MPPSSTTATRSEALFASDVQPSQHPTPRQIDLAIAAMLGRIGSHGCAARVAQEFGDHPESATWRMRWAREAAQLSDGAAKQSGGAANGHPAKIHTDDAERVAGRRTQVTKALLA